MEEDQIREVIKDELGSLLKSDRYLIERMMQFNDGKNIQLGKTTGTKLGTETTQKLGFYNATPIVRPSALTAEVGGTIDGTYGAAEETEMINMRTRIGELEDTLQALGLLA